MVHSFSASARRQALRVANRFWPRIAPEPTTYVPRASHIRQGKDQSESLSCPTDPDERGSRVPRLRATAREQKCGELSGQTQACVRKGLAAFATIVHALPSLPILSKPRRPSVPGCRARRSGSAAQSLGDLLRQGALAERAQRCPSLSPPGALRSRALGSARTRTHRSDRPSTRSGTRLRRGNLRWSTPPRERCPRADPTLGGASRAPVAEGRLRDLDAEARGAKTLPRTASLPEKEDLRLSPGAPALVPSSSDCRLRECKFSPAVFGPQAWATISRPRLKAPQRPNPREGSSAESRLAGAFSL